MFAGLVHPIIHLGFGIEFKQPDIAAHALAQASVHKDYLADCIEEVSWLMDFVGGLPSLEEITIEEDLFVGSSNIR
ncbi:hypothetical protein N7471_001271 [Penicillium samsonianum]|uniref:uncharacterized protein n=1 Tax=Penicillium samsonianum TaxID=1882272 RepID=UPI00254923B9|nr:uncharacterized protein N7471_001271 [Penicillium samsonianum]KAJ6150072.1 hypothetical protein N7471_001271 [Penicillium samsonianum]